jgi:hypothetical protein
LVSASNTTRRHHQKDDSMKNYRLEVFPYFLTQQGLGPYSVPRLK